MLSPSPSYLFSRSGLRSSSITSLYFLYPYPTQIILFDLTGVSSCPLYLGVCPYGSYSSVLLLEAFFYIVRLCHLRRVAITILFWLMGLWVCPSFFFFWFVCFLLFSFFFLVVVWPHYLLCSWIYKQRCGSQLSAFLKSYS